MNKTNFDKLKEVVAELRHPVTGCPWDLKQTHETLLKYLLEESYEYIEACLLYTSPSPRDGLLSRMPSSA